MYEIICCVWRNIGNLQVLKLSEITNFRFSDSEFKTGLEKQNWPV